MLTLAWFLGKDAVQFTGRVSQQSKVDNFRKIASARSNDGCSRMATNFHVCRQTQFLLLQFISASSLISRGEVSVPGEGGNSFSVLVPWFQDVESLSKVRLVTLRGTVGTVSHIQSCWWKGKDQQRVDPCKKYSLRNVQDFKPRLYCCSASNYDEHKGVSKKILSESCWNPKILTKIEKCGAKFSHGHVFEALDPLSPSLKQPSLLKTASSQGCCAGYCWLNGCTVVPAAFCK